MNTYTYIIDAQDRYSSLSNNWSNFASANSAASNCLPDSLLHTTLWDSIKDPETAHLYRVIVDQARAQQRTFCIPFRCDAPDRRRFLELVILPHPDGSIEFQSHILREERRDTVDLLDPSIVRTDEFIKMCSMCKQVKLTDERWEEVETAIEVLHLFDAPVLPQISHGICPACFEIAMLEIKSLT